MAIFSNNTVLLQDQTQDQPQWLLFNNPIEILQAHHPEEVIDCLNKIEHRVASGLYAVGFISYEASSAMDSALQCHPPEDLPIVWFLICDRYQTIDLPQEIEQDFSLGHWEPSVSWNEYQDAISKIKSHIRDGDAYQVNYTMRLRAAFTGNPWHLFLSLHRAQNASYSAYVQLDQYTICSVSPELFFSLENGTMTCKPMKGTIERGISNTEDDTRKQWLYHSEKNRAENVMIVDMIRNDIGTIAETGSVHVEKLFSIEKYPTVQQMTSTVSGKVNASISQIIRKMFPCASITGAPKAKTMEIIKNLEKDRRGIYTGSIGYIAPHGKAQFNVAIRTVVIDHNNNSAEYGVGSGIVWDSEPEEEYEECKIKAAVLMRHLPEFALIESVLWDPENGLYLLDLHIERLLDSARYFQFDIQMETLHQKLEQLQSRRPRNKLKLRIVLSRFGEIEIEEQPLGTFVGHRVALATAPIATDSPFLRHKTTHRDVYQQALNQLPSVQDVMLWNHDGFITESCNTNIVILHQGELLTPPEAHGLLPGIFRRHLLNQGVIKTSAITKQALLDAEKIFLINSVRGWMALEKTNTHEWIIKSEGNYDCTES